MHVRDHLHHGVPCVAHRHNALAKYSKEAFMKTSADAPTTHPLGQQQESEQLQQQ